MSREDQMIDRVAQAAIQGRMAAPPQSQQQMVNITMPLEGLAKLVEVKVLTPEQLFGMVFRNQAPTEYKGPKDQ